MKKQNKQQISFWTLLGFIFFLALAALCLSLNTGCSGYRSAVKSALVSNYQPTVILAGQHSTNLYGRASCPPSSRSPDQTVTADAQVNAPIILCAEQINLMIFGGTAASNSVLSDIKIPLTGTP